MISPGNLFPPEDLFLCVKAPRVYWQTVMRRP
jgi:hypothetical protein